MALLSKPSKRITGKQRAARKRNIKIAQRAKLRKTGRGGGKDHSFIDSQNRVITSKPMSKRVKKWLNK